MVEIATFLLLGVVSGFIAGLLGVGGGLVIVPALLYLLAFEVQEAVLMHTAIGTAIGTALAVIVFTSMSSVWAHHRHGAICWQYVRKLAPTIVLGAFSGAMIVQYLSFDFLRLFFAMFEIMVAIIMWFGISASGHVDHLNRWIWWLVGYVIGLVSTVVGIGGGTMTTPFLSYNKVDIKTTIATSAAVGMPIVVAGALGFVVAGWQVQSSVSGLGFIHLQALLSIVATSVLFAPLGAKVAHRVEGKKLTQFFALFLAFLSLSVLVF